jgi:very-short-patch-repair endonuclease
LARLGKRASEETRRRLSIAHLGHKLSKESIAKRTITRRRNGWCKNPEEFRKKISEGNTGKVRSEDARRKNSLAHIGSVGFWKDKRRSEETNMKISRALIGRPSANKGISKSEEACRRMSLALRGKKKAPRSEEYRQNIRKAHLGFKYSDASRKRMSESHKNPPEELRVRLRQIRLTRIFPLKDTKIEVKIQNFLSMLDIGFVKHKVMDILHCYQCDVFVPSLNLVIECDGDFIHCNPYKYSADFVRFPSRKPNLMAKDIWQRDKVRTNELIEKGFSVMRLWEHEIERMSVSEFKAKLYSLKPVGVIA